jgi:hypothetical protein
LYTTGSSCTPRVPLGLCIQTIRMRSICCLSVLQVLTVCSSDHLLRSGTSRSFSLQQSRQTVSLKTTDPIFHRSWRIAQKTGHLRAGHTLGYQKHSVETVIVARFFRAAYLILQSENDRGRVNGVRFDAPVAAHARQHYRGSCHFDYLIDGSGDGTTTPASVLSPWFASRFLGTCFGVPPRERRRLPFCSAQSFF